jgi:hypothetical protein
MKLQEDFPHDRVIQRMIESEFRDNKMFKYPEEYDVFDPTEEKDIKMKGKSQKMIDWGARENIQEKKRQDFEEKEHERAQTNKLKIVEERERYEICEDAILLVVQE